jgi:nitroreductase
MMSEHSVHALAAHPLDLYEGLVTTRAIRRYRDAPVPEADLSQMLFAATRAPSGHNTQPVRFIVLRNDGSSAAARAILADGFRQAWSAERREPDPGDDSRRARMARAMNHFVDNIGSAPVIVVVCCIRGRVREGVVPGASVFPACQNLLLAARALGYGGVISMWHRPVLAELSQALEVPADVDVVATIPIGVPVGRHGPVRRLPLRDVVYDGRFGRAAEWLDEPDGVRYAGTT